MQLPIAWRDEIPADLIFLVLRFEPQISLYPYAEPFPGIDFAPALKTPAAGSVALILGTLGNRAQIRNVKQGAVSTILAAVKSGLAAALHEMKCPASKPRGVQESHDPLHQLEQRAPGLKNQRMNQSR